MTATFDDVRRIGLALAEVTESTSYGTPSLKVNGKSLCRQWSDREHDRDGIHDTEVLVVFCELDVKDALIEASEGVLFSTTHYHDYGAMLIDSPMLSRMTSPTGSKTATGFEHQPGSCECSTPLSPTGRDHRPHHRRATTASARRIRSQTTC